MEHELVPAKRLVAGVVFTDPGGRVLLLQPSRSPSWEIPGVLVENGESPRSAARRAVRGKLGLEVAIGSLLVLDWLPAVEIRPEGVRLVYDGGTLDDHDARSIRLAGEINAYGFVDLGSAVGLVPARLERRIAAALHARRSGRTIELEDGRPQIAREVLL